MQKQIEEKKMKKGQASSSPQKKFKNLKRTLETNITELYEFESTFTFKILRPWVVLTEGDTIGARHIVKNTEKTLMMDRSQIVSRLYSDEYES